jgi:hypothetical protein
MNRAPGPHVPQVHHFFIFATWDDLTADFHRFSINSTVTLPFLVGGFKHEWIMTFHFIYGNSNPN